VTSVPAGDTEYVDLFDETGRLVRAGVPRASIGDHSGLGEAFVKVVHGIPVNVAGEVLLQQRAWSKAIWPGRWALLGGHVDSGETSEEALLREFREEYGIDAAQAPRAMVHRLVQRIGHSLMEFWLILIDVKVADIVCEPGEVASAGYRSVADLVKLYDTDDRWGPGEEPYRAEVVELFRAVPDLARRLRASAGN